MHKFTYINQIEDRNVKVGDHFFNKDAQRFFNSRILSEVYNGQYFITSEQFAQEPRLYTVRRIDAGGSIRTVSEFQGFKTIAQARAFARVQEPKED